MGNLMSKIRYKYLKKWCLPGSKLIKGKDKSDAANYY